MWDGGKGMVGKGMVGVGMVMLMVWRGWWVGLWLWLWFGGDGGVL